jgi:hypothetical protein
LFCHDLTNYVIDVKRNSTRNSKLQQTYTDQGRLKGEKFVGNNNGRQAFLFGHVLHPALDLMSGQYFEMLMSSHCVDELS